MIPLAITDGMIKSAEDLVEKHGVEAVVDVLTYLYSLPSTNWTSQMEDLSQLVRELWDYINSEYVLIQKWTPRDAQANQQK